MAATATRATLVVRTNGADADDEIVWSWPPDAEAKSCGDEPRDDGSKKARFPGRARKTIAQGMPDDLAEPVVPSPCFFHCTGGHGLRPAPGIPCAL